MSSNKPKTAVGAMAKEDKDLSLAPIEQEVLAEKPTQNIVEHRVSVEEMSAAKRRADNQFMKKRIKGMSDLMKSSDKVTLTPSAGYAQFLGSTFTFLLNAFPITVRLNGKPQIFPRPIAEVVTRKLSEALEANAPKDEVKRVRV